MDTLYALNRADEREAAIAMQRRTIASTMTANLQNLTHTTIFATDGLVGWRRGCSGIRSGAVTAARGFKDFGWAADRFGDCRDAP
jgi:hypothetical protein